MAETQKGFDLAAVLGSVSNLDTPSHSKIHLEDIDIDLIAPDPRNRPIEKIRELAENIVLVGLQQPLAVRPDPDAEGHYIVVSGHRRREAIRLLVDEGEEDYRMVPCLVAPADMSESMIMLLVLSGNVHNQALTPAELALAAEQMSRYIYEEKEAGREFPGKVRDYVAKQCGIHASRVGRLKIISEKLAECWREDWNANKLAESSADVLAHCTHDIQEKIYDALIGNGEHEAADLSTWQLSDIIGRLRSIDASVASDCELDDCARRADRESVSMSLSPAWEMCAYCCKSCPSLGRCDKVCEPCRELATKRAAEYEENKRRQEAQAKQREAERAKAVQSNMRTWGRLSSAMKAAGRDRAWLVDCLGWDWMDKFDGLDAVLAGQVDESENWAGESPFEGEVFEDMVKVADDLDVSLDYLAGRTSDPGRQIPSTESAQDAEADIVPRWQTGVPDKVGPYVCKVPYAGRTFVEVIKWRGSEWDMDSAGFSARDQVLRWCPIPEDTTDE